MYDLKDCLGCREKDCQSTTKSMSFHTGCQTRIAPCRWHPCLVTYWIL